jgi:hypothetical protein
MSISITFSSSNGGSALTDPVSYGNTSNGNTTGTQVIYVSHNGLNPITSCGLYIDIASSYAGSFTAIGDKTEIINWGDASSAGSFGGFEINTNATGSFPGSSWPTYANKTSTDGYGFTVRTGVGDSSLNAITIPTVTGATSSGTIQTGSSPNVRFSTRMVIPTSVNTVGTRQFKLTLKYTYTS